MSELTIAYWVGFGLGLFAGGALGISVYALIYAGRER